MDIKYRSNRIEKLCLDRRKAESKYGYEMAEKIQLRIQEISAIDTVEQMIEFNIGRCHPLKGDRKGQFAVDLVGPYRLVFIKLKKGIKISSIQTVEIQDIEDYH